MNCKFNKKQSSSTDTSGLAQNTIDQSVTAPHKHCESNASPSKGFKEMAKTETENIDELPLIKMTVEQCRKGFDNVRNRLRLDDDHDLPASIIPQATSIQDHDGVWRDLKISTEAKAVSFELGFDVVVMPVLRLNNEFTPGHYFENRITILVADQPQAKSYTYYDGVPMKCGNPPNTKYFSTFVVLVNNVEELQMVVKFITILPRCSIVRGHCIAPNWSRILRRKHDDTDRNGRLIRRTFEDAPLLWGAGDIDNLNVPDGLSYKNPQLLGEYARACMPPEIHDVKIFYKFSSSAILGSEDKIKMHIYWWNKQPITSVELKAWSMQLRACTADQNFIPILDKMLPQTVQIHFTSLPILSGGLEDPLGADRMGMLGGNDTADLLPACKKEITFAERRVIHRERKRKEVFEANPFLATAYTMGSDGSVPSALWDKIIAEDLGEGRADRGLYAPIWRLVQTAVQHDAKEDDIINQIGMAVRAKHKQKGSPHDWVADIENYCSTQYLKKLIERARKQGVHTS